MVYFDLSKRTVLLSVSPKPKQNRARQSTSKGQALARASAPHEAIALTPRS